MGKFMQGKSGTCQQEIFAVPQRGDQKGVLPGLLFPAPVYKIDKLSGCPGIVRTSKKTGGVKAIPNVCQETDKNRPGMKVNKES